MNLLIVSKSFSVLVAALLLAPLARAESSAKREMLLKAKLEAAQKLISDAYTSVYQLHEKGLLPGLAQGEELSNGRLNTSENPTLLEGEIYPKYFMAHWTKEASDDKSVFTYLLVKRDPNSQWSLKAAWRVSPNGIRSILTIKK